MKRLIIIIVLLLSTAAYARTTVQFLQKDVVIDNEESLKNGNVPNSV